MYALSSLSLLGYFSLHAQATSSPTIHTNLGVGSVIDICKNDQLNLIGSGDAGLTSSTFEFFRTRNGSTTIVRANDASNNFTTSDLQNGDHFYARVNRILPLPAVSANSSSITINITPTPEIQSLTSDQTGNTINNGGLTFVYKIQLTNEIFFLPAVKLGYSSSSISIDNVIFEDQINTLSGFINTESIDPLAQQIGTVNYIDLGTSFIIHNEVFIAGLSIGHLNQPNTNFNKESEEKLPISLSLQAGYEFDINPYQRRFLPEFSYLYFYGSFTKLDQALQISLSQELQLGNFQLELVNKLQN